MKRTVEVLFTIDVEIDESKFDEKFMKEFRESFFNFNTIEEHIEHLGQLAVRGVAHDNFIEGYGHPDEMGIVFTEEDWESELQ